jgi:hypothetical protein
VFDSIGTMVTLVGREGAGPGEFRNPGLAGFVGDTIWIFELGRNSYVLFNRALRPIGQVLTDADAWNWYGVFAGSQSMLELDRPIGAPRVVEIRDARGRSARPLAIDSLRQHEQRFPLRIRGREREFRSPIHSTAQLRPAPGGREAIFLDPGDLWSGQPGQMAMRRVTFPRGEVSAPVVVSMTPRPITPADRDTLIVRATSSIREYESDFRGAVRFPDYYPAFQWFQLVGLDGSLWLTEFMNDDSRLVISADGRPLMRVRAPSDLRLLGASATHVWGVLPDADDVPMVVRYRIVEPGTR